MDRAASTYREHGRTVWGDSQQSSPCSSFRCYFPFRGARAQTAGGDTLRVHLHTGCYNAATSTWMNALARSRSPATLRGTTSAGCILWLNAQMPWHHYRRHTHAPLL